MGTWLAIGAIVISIVSLIWTIASTRKQYKYSSLTANSDAIIEIESRVGKNPALMRFHGVDDWETALRDHGITAEEYAYLLNNFTAGGTYFRNNPYNARIIRPGSYRDLMCKSEHTRRAWPLVRIMLAESEFRNKIDQLTGFKASQAEPKE